MSDGELVGFCCFGRDAQVAGGDYGLPALDVGLGLRPDLVGRGLGGSFVGEVLDFALRTLDPPRFRLTVATLNRRALTVYERTGFEVVGRFQRPASEGRTPPAEFIVLVREIV